MSVRPDVSVVMPVRDAATTIRDALESVLVQANADFEMIAVDDGSTDGSSEILRKACDGDPRVRVVVNPGRGLTVGLNHGITLAQGRFIARQDADDLSMPGRFEQQVAYLDRHPEICAIGTASVIVNDAGAVIGRFPTRHGAAAVRAGLRSARATPVHGSMMIRRESLAVVGGYRPTFSAAQDFDLWLRLLERWDIDNLETPLYQWRVSPSSVYGARRETQVKYAGIALAFAEERRRDGADSYDLLVQCEGDLELFARGYRLRGLLRAVWGDLLFRATGDASLARRHFKMALEHGHVRPTTLLLWAWTSCGLPWIGGKPLRPAGTAPRAGRGAGS